DDVLERMKEPATAELVAGLAMRADDPARRLGLTAMLARRLADDWSAARDRPPVVQLIERALGDPEARAQGIALAASTRDVRYRATIEKLAEDSQVPEDVQVAAVEALGSFRGLSARILDRLIATVQGKPS